MSTLEAVCIFNPVAGRGRALAWRRAVADACRAAGLAHRELVTEHPGHARDLAEEAAGNGARLVVAVGGDGTVHEVVNGLAAVALPAGPALAVVPAGTGNDFARTVGIPREPGAAVRLVARGRERAVDLADVNGRTYCNIAGIGFDAEVAREVNRAPKRLPGPLTYLLGVFKILAAYHPVAVRYELDGQPFAEPLLLMAVGNGRFYGGGMMMCPAAEIDDGLLDVCIGGDLGKLETLGVLPRVFSGTHVRHPKVRVVRAREVRVLAADRPLAIHADGEVVSESPAVFRVLPGALRVLVEPEPAGQLA